MKKALTIICSGVLLIGLALVIVGFAFGGRPGGITVRDGNFVFLNSRETVILGSAPSWVGQNWSGYIFNWGVPNYNNDSNQNRPNHSSASAVAAPFSAGEMKKLKLDISAGYLIVRTGKEASLSVDGSLKYTSYFEDNTWHIKTDEYDFESKLGRFLWRGNDLTTTFTLTVPEKFDRLELDIGLGDAEINGLTLNELEVVSGMASVEVTDTSATTSDLEADMGELTVTGFQGTECKLDADMGSIDFEGNISASAEFNCSMGSISATLPRPRNYGWSAKAGMGSISIDGENAASGLDSKSEGGSKSAKPYFDLNCDMGSIEITFS